MYPIKVLCNMMNVTRSGFYRYLHKATRQGEDKELILLIKVREIHKRSKESYGSRRIAKAFQAEAIQVGRYRARTLMRKAEVRCKQRRRYKVTTISKPQNKVAANKLNRKFSAEQPNQAWVTDITYLWTKEGWLYLAAVLDLFSRKIVGWRIAKHLRTELIIDALEKALAKCENTSNLMIHSDRGCQYTSQEYQGKLKERGIEISMSRKGNCWDNAVMERFFGSLKSERTDHRTYYTREEARADVADYIERFYNCERLHSTLGYVSPMQYEKAVLS